MTDDEIQIEHFRRLGAKGNLLLCQKPWEEYSKEVLALALEYLARDARCHGFRWGGMQEIGFKE